MGETLEQAQDRLRAVVTGLLAADLEKGRWDLWRAIEGYPEWVTNGHFAARIDPEHEMALPGATVDRGRAEDTVFGPAAEKGAPLVRLPLHDVPTTTRVEEKDVGCPGCGCGVCLGWSDRRTDTVETVGQVVYGTPHGPMGVDPRYAPLLEGLDVRAGGCGMLVGRHGETILSVVMRLRYDPSEIQQRAADYAEALQ